MKHLIKWVGRAEDETLGIIETWLVTDADQFDIDCAVESYCSNWQQLPEDLEACGMLFCAALDAAGIAYEFEAIMP